MPSKPLDTKKVEQILQMRRAGATVREISEKLGVSNGVVVKYCKSHGGSGRRLPKLKLVGGVGAPSDPLDVPIDQREVDGSTRILTLDKPKTLDEMAELFGVDRDEWVSEYFRANEWQGFYKLADGKGHKKVTLYQTRVVWKRKVEEPVAAAMIEFAKRHVQPVSATHKARKQPATRPFMLVWGLWDAHLGMYAWDKEVGESFDLDIATRRVLNSVDDMAAELEPYQLTRVVMPIGNDFMHFDSVRHTTTHGTHFLDTDTRYSKVFLEGLRCQAYMVQRALEVGAKVDALYVPGNHDVTSSFAMCVALAERFRNEKRFSMDLRMNPRKAVMHGGTLVAFDHGQDCKPNQLNTILATEFKDLWARSTYREVQVGHLHQRWEKQYEGVTPTNGVLVRRNPALCNVDAWHHKGGLVGEPMKSVEAWRYDETGFRGSHVTWARDDERAPRQGASR